MHMLKELTRRNLQAARLPFLVATLLLLLMASLLAPASPAHASPTQSAATASSSAVSGNGGGGGGGGAGGGGGGSLGLGQAESKGIFKRSFAGLGCLGVYDKAKFARLDRVCEECYTLYREPDIHSACRQDCFRNSVFTRCVDALLLSHEAKKFDEMVDELYGK